MPIRITRWDKLNLWNVLNNLMVMLIRTVDFDKEIQLIEI